MPPTTNDVGIGNCNTPPPKEKAPWPPIAVAQTLPERPNKPPLASHPCLKRSLPFGRSSSVTTTSSPNRRLSAYCFTRTSLLCSCRWSLSHMLFRKKASPMGHQ